MTGKTKITSKTTLFQEFVVGEMVFHKNWGELRLRSSLTMDISNTMGFVWACLWPLLVALHGSAL